MFLFRLSHNHKKSDVFILAVILFKSSHVKCIYFTPQLLSLARWVYNQRRKEPLGALFIFTNYQTHDLTKENNNDLL